MLPSKWLLVFITSCFLVDLDLEWLSFHFLFTIVPVDTQLLFFVKSKTSAFY
jgi:hypothetical protein